MFVPSWRIELRHWHELCHPYLPEILIVEGSYAGIGYSFMVAYLRIFGFSERTIEHESKKYD